MHAVGEGGIIGEGGIVEEQLSTAKAPVDEENHLVPSVVDLRFTVGDNGVVNTAENPHPTETDVEIQTLVNEIFSIHTPVESDAPQRSRSDAQDLCPFCGLMLNRKNLQVHLRRKHPDQVSSQEKPTPAQLKTAKQHRLPLQKQQKVRKDVSIIYRVDLYLNLSTTTYCIIAWSV